MPKKTILLTGSGGFIGRHLKEFLGQANTVLAPRSAELDLRQGRAVDAFLAAHAVDAIVHASACGGARGVADAPQVEADNWSMFENLCRVRGGVPMIVFGSGAQYDKSRPLEKVRESELGTHVPHDGYGRAKLRIARAVEASDNITCLTVFGCFGAYEKPSRFPTYAILQSLRGRPIEILRNARFDYLYVDDLCRIVAAFLRESPPCRVLNVTPNRSIDMRGIAEIVNRLGEKPVPVQVGEEAAPAYTGDNARLRAALPRIVFTPYEWALGRLYGQVRAACKNGGGPVW